MNTLTKSIAVSLFLLVGISLNPFSLNAEGTPTTYNTVEVDGIEIFYREAGSRKNPTLLLLHGYPTSSHMFRNLMRDLSDEYHLIAPDYPGYGRSEQPPMARV